MKKWQRPQSATQPDRKPDQDQDEPQQLSPKRIAEGASLKTELIEAMLAQDQTRNAYPHWGINE